ncbi:DUF192 domain-containing protein [Oerskovia turbata]|uniref:DUF192 domain-containing protein n=1 Tax=Oerskovia turbata TaxID=1713 RepID=A0A4Q1KQ23_9CELL|nr:DUF192 domain-containing protein [Oerskovia turbata]RXR31952.1 DUF192 domain-containing protein [Oerskovia turbata]TGJ96930.1 hypothetical protein DLJ96_02475 [Actinotalea fermentans ATCC 43279 = JCM 9966 = DSM 3133]
MARTRVPLDIAWILDGQVVAVEALPPCDLDVVTDCPIYASPGAVDSLLEVAAGALTTVESGDAVLIPAPEAAAWLWDREDFTPSLALLTIILLGWVRNRWARLKFRCCT